MEINGKTALVTGGAHRVGQAITLALAAAGANVVINYHSSASAAEETVAQAQALGVGALAVQADVADLVQTQALVAEAEDRFGSLTILINSASPFTKTPFPMPDYADWHRVTAVLLDGPLYLSNAVAPMMLEQGEGAIVNIVDLSAWQPWPGFLAHSVGKAGLMAMTRQLALELAPEVQVNAVAPGPVLPPPGYGQERTEQVANRTLKGRWGAPQDVADAVLYLIQANYITGEVLVVDGGERLATIGHSASVILTEEIPVQLRRFSGQAAIVTGAASGIGKACALRFSQEGANVACLDVMHEACQAVAAESALLGVETISLYCDVTNPDSIRAAVQSVLDRWGRVDVLVASAGIYTGSPLAEVPLSQWQRLIDINLTGVFLCNQAVAPIMMGQRSGSIINISSMAGKTSFPASAEYSASKSGVIGLTRSVAMELAPYGATANAVCPGNTLTEMVKSVAEEVGSRDGLTAKEWLQMRAADCPMRRMAEPWEIAGLCAFLASQDSRYITGQAIEVDGGMVMS